MGAVIIVSGACTAHAQAPARIDLPEMLAIELPAPAMTSIGPGASPLKELLESAVAPGRQVTHDVRSPLPLGATQVTWTAWSAAPETSQSVATRQAWVYIFPLWPDAGGHLWQARRHGGQSFGQGRAR